MAQSFLSRLQSKVITSSYEVNIFRYSTLFHVLGGLSIGLLLNYFFWKKTIIYLAASWYALCVIFGTIWYEKKRESTSDEADRIKIKDKASKARMIVGAIPALTIVTLASGGIESPAIILLPPSIQAAVLVMGEKGGRAAAAGAAAVMIMGAISTYMIGSMGPLAFVLLTYHLILLTVSFSSTYIFYSQTVSYQKKIQAERALALFELQTVKIFLDNKDMAGAVFGEDGRVLKSSALYDRVVGGDIQKLLDIIPSDVREACSATIWGALESDVLNWEGNETQLPRSLILKGEHYNVSWQPVLSGDIVTGVVFVATNIEELNRAKAEAQKSSMSAGLLLNIAEAGAFRMNLLLEYGASLLAVKGELNQAAALPVPDPQLRQASYIKLHTAKGATRTYGFMHLASLLHETETLLSTPTEALLKIEEALREFHLIEDLCRKINFNNSVLLNQESAEQVLMTNDPVQAVKYLKDQVYQPLNKLLEGFRHDIKLNADKLNKPNPELRITCGDFYVASKASTGRNVAKSLNDSFIHIIRNTLDHGIESSEERVSKGKNVQGTIWVKVEEGQGRVRIRVADDGRGLNVTKIRSRAQAMGLLSTAENNIKAIANMIFIPEFSTAEKITEISGRGIGMSAIKDAAVALGGTAWAEPFEQDGDFVAWELVLDFPSSVLFTGMPSPSRPFRQDAA